MQIRKSVLSWLILLILLFSGFSVYLSVPKIVPARLIDLRKDKSVNHYALMIILRESGLYGHTFFSTSNYSNQDTIPITQGFGLYSTTFDLTEIVKGDTEGKVLEEFSRINMSNQVKLNLVIWVDQAQFEQCVNIMNKAFEKSEKYELLNNDCITFIDKFIDVLGLKKPSRFINPTPHLYVESLFELN